VIVGVGVGALLTLGVGVISKLARGCSICEAN